MGGDQEVLGLVRATVAGDEVDEFHRAARGGVGEGLALHLPAVALQFGGNEFARLFQFGRAGGARPKVALGLGVGEGFFAGKFLPNLRRGRPGGRGMIAGRLICGGRLGFACAHRHQQERQGDAQALFTR